MSDINQKFFENLGDVVSNKRETDANNQAYAFVDNKEKVYFLMSSESEGRCYRLEFWVDTYADNRWTLQKKLQEFVSHNLLTHELVSYYSAIGCRLRQRTDGEHIADDVTRFKGEVCRNVLNGDSQSEVEAGAVIEEPLVLPCQCPLAEVAERINNENIVLPAVQRGRVWNAARCATLWDSILRGFSIGALSVQPDNGKYNLLDGQQRTTAILLGYAPFPPKKEESCRQDVLWLDLCPRTADECKFHFYVTTAAQPWGYVRSTDETKNERLKFWEVREMLADLDWHDKSDKPYPYELWPKKAVFPVPFKLFQDYVKEPNANTNAKDFLAWCKKKCNVEWNWLRHNEKFPGLDLLKVSEDIWRAVREDIEKRTVLVQNAGKMTDDDVSLYFARIGKGGVIPSNEELAYSVLKVKLGKGGGDFREGIEAVATKLGLERPSRIAAMVVRYCLSVKNPDQPELYTGDVLGKIIEATHTTESPQEKNTASGSESWIGDLQSLVRFDDVKKDSQLIVLCKGINDELSREGYTNWHISRYCQRHNGVVYQFLMMLFKMTDALESFNDFVWNDLHLTIGGVAELLCWYAPDPAYVIRKVIASKSFAEGFAAALSETYYGAPRMTIPIPCARLNGVVDVLKDVDEQQIVETTEAAIKQSAELSGLVSTGYGDEVSYSMLIFACNRHFKDLNPTDRTCGLFTYNSNLEVWREDARPWDYDHILPHSWIDNRLKTKVERERYSWLVNSIGNLAPIDFSTNRSLSDGSRDKLYPLMPLRSDESPNEGQLERAKAKQSVCFIEELDATLIEQMGRFPEPKSIAAFYRMTLSRFIRLYKCWSASLISDGSDVRSSFRLDHKPVALRKYTIENLQKSVQCSIIYQDANGAKREAETLDDFDWYVWPWMGVSCDHGLHTVEVWFDRSCNCQWGIRDPKSQKYEKRADVCENVVGAIEEALRKSQP